MDIYEKKAIKLVGESRTRIEDARLCCEDGRMHVASSRKAVARSLRLLQEPFKRLHD